MDSIRPTIFLDRDGTINTLNGYISRFEQIQIIEGVPEAIQIFNKLGFLVLVITNQPVIEMGLIGKEELENIHAKLSLEIKEKGGHIDAFFYCPHSEVGSRFVKTRVSSCSCRKPRTGLIKEAMELFQVDLTKSFMIGDSWRDVELAKNIGINHFQISNSGDSDNKTGNFVQSLLESALNIEKLLKDNVEF